MRILALDVGTNNIGIAISDELEIIASAVDTLRRTNTASDFEHIAKIIKDRGVKELVVGLPVTLSSKETDSTKKVTEFVEQLKPYIDVPVIFRDERLTTKEAEKLLISFDTSRKKRRNVIDRMAAQLILQGYLDTKKRPV